MMQREGHECMDIDQADHCLHLSSLGTANISRPTQRNDPTSSASIHSWIETRPCQGISFETDNGTYESHVPWINHTSNEEKGIDIQDSNNNNNIYDKDAIFQDNKYGILANAITKEMSTEDLRAFFSFSDFLSALSPEQRPQFKSIISAAMENSCGESDKFPAGTIVNIIKEIMTSNHTGLKAEENVDSIVVEMQTSRLNSKGEAGERKKFESEPMISLERTVLEVLHANESEKELKDGTENKHSKTIPNSVSFLSHGMDKLNFQNNKELATVHQNEEEISLSNTLLNENPPRVKSGKQRPHDGKYEAIYEALPCLASNFYPCINGKDGIEEDVDNGPQLLMSKNKILAPVIVSRSSYEETDNTTIESTFCPLSTTENNLKEIKMNCLDELEQLRKQKVAKLKNRQYSEIMKKTAEEKAQEDAALADLEARKAATSKFRASRPVINEIDKMYVQLNRQRAMSRQKEQETVSSYRAIPQVMSELDKMYVQLNKQRAKYRQKEEETVTSYRNSPQSLSELDKMYVQLNKENAASHRKKSETTLRYQHLGKTRKNDENNITIATLTRDQNEKAPCRKGKQLPPPASQFPIDHKSASIAYSTIKNNIDDKTIDKSESLILPILSNTFQNKKEETNLARMEKVKSTTGLLDKMYICQEERKYSGISNISGVYNEKKYDAPAIYLSLKESSPSLSLESTIPSVIKISTPEDEIDASATNECFAKYREKDAHVAHFVSALSSTQRNQFEYLFGEDLINSTEIDDTSVDKSIVNILKKFTEINSTNHVGMEKQLAWQRLSTSDEPIIGAKEGTAGTEDNLIKNKTSNDVAPSFPISMIGKQYQRKLPFPFSKPTNVRESKSMQLSGHKRKTKLVHSKALYKVDKFEKILDNVEAGKLVQTIAVDVEKNKIKEDRFDWLGKHDLTLQPAFSLSKQEYEKLVNKMNFPKEQATEEHRTESDLFEQIHQDSREAKDQYTLGRKSSTNVGAEKAAAVEMERYRFGKNLKKPQQEIGVVSKELKQTRKTIDHSTVIDKKRLLVPRDNTYGITGLASELAVRTNGRNCTIVPESKRGGTLPKIGSFETSEDKSVTVTASNYKFNESRNKEEQLESTLLHTYRKVADLIARKGEIEKHLNRFSRDGNFSRHLILDDVMNKKDVEKGSYESLRRELKMVDDELQFCTKTINTSLPTINERKACIEKVLDRGPNYSQDIDKDPILSILQTRLQSTPKYNSTELGRTKTVTTDKADLTPVKSQQKKWSFDHNSSCVTTSEQRYSKEGEKDPILSALQNNHISLPKRKPTKSSKGTGSNIAHGGVVSKSVRDISEDEIGGRFDYTRNKCSSAQQSGYEADNAEPELTRNEKAANTYQQELDDKSERRKEHNEKIDDTLLLTVSERIASIKRTMDHGSKCSKDRNKDPVLSALQTRLQPTPKYNSSGSTSKKTASMHTLISESAVQLPSESNTLNITTNLYSPLGTKKFEIKVHSKNKEERKDAAQQALLERTVDEMDKRSVSDPSEVHHIGFGDVRDSRNERLKPMDDSLLSENERKAPLKIALDPDKRYLKDRNNEFESAANFDEKKTVAITTGETQEAFNESSKELITAKKELEFFRESIADEFKRATTEAMKKLEVVERRRDIDDKKLHTKQEPPGVLYCLQEKNEKEMENDDKKLAFSMLDKGIVMRDLESEHECSMDRHPRKTSEIQHSNLELTSSKNSKKKIRKESEIFVDEGEDDAEKIAALELLVNSLQEQLREDKNEVKDEIVQWQEVRESLERRHINLLQEFESTKESHILDQVGKVGRDISILNKTQANIDTKIEQVKSKATPIGKSKRVSRKPRPLPFREHRKKAHGPKHREKGRKYEENK